MRVRIESDDGVSRNARLTLEDGTPLQNVSKLVVTLEPNAPVTAQATFLLPHVNILGHVTVSEDHLRELAAAHGYELKRRSD